MDANGSARHGLPERRANPRVRLQDLACIHVGPDNGAIILDVSDGGILFCAVAPIHQTGIIQLRLTLWDDRRVEATARLVWIDDAKKSGGLQFVSVPAEVREHILKCCPDHSFPSLIAQKVSPAQPPSDERLLTERSQEISRPQMILPERKERDRSFLAALAAAVSEVIPPIAEQSPQPSPAALKGALAESTPPARVVNASHTGTKMPDDAGVRLGVVPGESQPAAAWKKMIGQTRVTARLSTLPERRLSGIALASSAAFQGLLVVILVSLPVFFPQKLMKIAYEVIPVASPETAVLLPPKVPDIRARVQEIPPPEQPPARQRTAKLTVPRALLPPKMKFADVPFQAPEINQTIPQVKIEPPAAEPARPREAVKTGLLPAGSAAPATVSAPIAKVQTGGFGDPRGLPGPSDPNQRANIASFGSPVLPVGPGEGNGTGGASGIRGTVASAGFGNGVASPTQRGPVNSQGQVKSGVFAAAIGDPESPKPKTSATFAAVQPVVILDKPNPVYTDEARRQAIEGDVLVEVVFSASGQVQIIQVVKGLGHGLDEAATRAAQQIRFKPALQDGQPVDFPAVIHIVFQLAF